MKRGRRENEQANRKSNDVGQASHKERNEPNKEQPEAHESHRAEGSETKARVRKRDVAVKTGASEPIETELQRGVCPEEPPDRGRKEEPSHASHHRCYPAIADSGR
jgi:hypothetical protein